MVSIGRSSLGTRATAGERVGPERMPIRSNSSDCSSSRVGSSRRHRGAPPCSSARSSGVSAAGPLDQHRHLVADEADVAVGGGDHGQARAVADAGHEDEGVLHLDDDLVTGAAAEAAGRAVGESDEPGGHRGEAVGGVAVEAGRHRHRQTVGGHHDGVADTGDTVDEVVDEPVDVLGLRGSSSPCVPRRVEDCRDSAGEGVGAGSRSPRFGSRPRCSPQR